MDISSTHSHAFILDCTTSENVRKFALYFDLKFHPDGFISSSKTNYQENKHDNTKYFKVVLVFSRKNQV